MFKIKDNVDLKELEKFGFKKTIFEDYYRLISNDDYFWVDINTKILDYTTPRKFKNLDAFIELYNILNQAGLIEKVEEV